MAKSTPPDNTAQILKESITNSRPSDFVHNYLLPALPTIFATQADYTRWRSSASTLLEVSPSNIFVVGSRLLGYSLSPFTPLRPVHQDSDLDLAVISFIHFEMAWNTLRKPTSAPRTTDAIEKAIKRHKEDLVFRGIVATDQIISVLSFSNQWVAAIDTLSKDIHSRDMSISIRIYRDMDALVDNLTITIAGLATKL